MAKGTYELALSKAGRMPVSAGRQTIVGRSTLRATYTDRRTLRWAGAIGGIVGVGGGITIMIVAGDGGREDNAGVLLGLATVLTTGITGLVLSLQSHSARLEIVPLEPATSRTPNEVTSTAAGERYGAGVRLRF